MEEIKIQTKGIILNYADKNFGTSCQVKLPYIQILLNH